MADASKRRFDVVAVWHFDRFARSTNQLLRALEQFRALGIEFVFTVLGAVAELERSLIVGAREDRAAKRASEGQETR